MFHLGERIALFLDIEPYRTDAADHSQADAIDRKRL